MVKNPPDHAGDTRGMGLMPRSRRSPGVGNATYSSILAWEIPCTAWQATVHGVAKSETQLSTAH